MVQITLIILATFLAGIFAQAPVELLAIEPVSAAGKVNQAYSSLPPDQQKQATQAAQSLSPTQRSQAQTFLSDPNVQNGNVNQASPLAASAGQSFCGSTTPDQQSFVFGLSNAVGVNVPSTACTSLGSGGGGSSPPPPPPPPPGPTPSPTFAPGPGPIPASTFSPATAGPSTGGGSGGPDSDKHERCCMWAQMGQCDQNPFWMKPNCRKACGTPGATIENALSKPSSPSQNCGMGGMGPGMGGMGPGMGGMGPGMGGMGPGMGGMGQGRPGCSDMHRNCQMWASMGQCNSNPFWMRPNCQQSCGSCGATIGTALNFGQGGMGGGGMGGGGMGGSGSGMGGGGMPGF